MTTKDVDLMINKLDEFDHSNKDSKLKNEIDSLKDIFKGMKNNLEIKEQRTNDIKNKNKTNEINRNNKFLEMKDFSTKDKSPSNEDEEFYKTNKPRINSKTKRRHKKRKRKVSMNSGKYMDKKICIEGCIGCNIF